MPSLTDIQTAIRKITLLAREEDNPITDLWLSFVDRDKPEGEQFLGVIVTKARGPAHAIVKLNEMGICPPGEVASMSVQGERIPPEHFNRLLTRDELIAAGYIPA
jgi:hypothetical protein